VSQRNVDIVRSFHEAFGAGDRVEWRRHFHPDVVWDVTDSAMPLAKVYRGHEGVEEFFRDWLGTWDDYRQETLEVIDAGDSVIVVFRQTGRGRSSGIEVDRVFYNLYELADGKVVRFRLFESREAALAAAGQASA
jgi:ketosteroid isomerase-like protein